MSASIPVLTQTMILSEDDVAAREQLEQSWRYPRGFIGWLRNTSHLSIGKRYIITAFVFFVLGGLEAGLMRLQLSRPENSWIGPDLYNQIFTMWVPGGIVYLLAALFLMLKWIRESGLRVANREAFLRTVALLLVVVTLGCMDHRDAEWAAEMTGGSTDRGRDAIQSYGCMSCS